MLDSAISLVPNGELFSPFTVCDARVIVVPRVTDARALTAPKPDSLKSGIILLNHP